MNLDSNASERTGTDVNSGDTSVPRPSLPPPPLTRWLVIAIGVLFAATMLGMAFVATLAVHAPLLLVALAPWPRHIILVAPLTPIEYLVPVAALRGLCNCVVAYEVGRLYGPRGIRIFERRSPMLGGLVRRFEQIFPVAAPVFVFAAPGPLTSTLSAITGYSRSMTLSLSFLGFALWAAINHQIGDFLAPYTAPILAFFKRYLLECTIVLVALVAGYQWFARKRRLQKEAAADHLQ